ncbi:MAG TPA: GNAT family N-acetyltransferase [Actinomycetota bacterium]|jgi:N-acetylglutamate synthase-like GNAT family acetyltransferase
MPSVPERYFAASDAALRGTRPTWWGAVVADDRFPDLYDLNHAKVSAEATDLTLAEVVAELEPPLRAAGSRHLQIVLLRPDAAPGLVEEATRRGLASSDDTVMELRGDAPAPADVGRVQPAEPGPELWEVLERSYREFDVTHPEVTEQLLRWNREVLAPRGRRYYLARREGRVAGIGALQVAAGIAYVDDVVTFPEHRRQGVASSIVGRIVRDAAGSGAAATFLLADEPGPIRLYRRLGFEDAGTIRTLLGPAPWVSGGRA